MIENVRTYAYQRLARVNQYWGPWEEATIERRDRVDHCLKLIEECQPILALKLSEEPPLAADFDVASAFGPDRPWPNSREHHIRAICGMLEGGATADEIVAQLECLYYTQTDPLEYSASIETEELNETIKGLLPIEGRSGDFWPEDSWSDPKVYMAYWDLVESAGMRFKHWMADTDRYSDSEFNDTDFDETERLIAHAKRMLSLSPLGDRNKQ